MSLAWELQSIPVLLLVQLASHVGATDSIWHWAAEEEVCEPAHSQTHWSAAYTKHTIAVHLLKTSQEWAKAWDDLSVYSCAQLEWDEHHIRNRNSTL